ncbi:NAD(P)-binding protein [Pholiota conissans]|uniref:Probable quinone oxidoreductase n=1 Tax=Pholiota conissans TaxID=109636 RepID=A0A9P6D852_9AGAR|nr:NAD(P)-binding protein [Pholiota conissans]
MLFRPRNIPLRLSSLICHLSPYSSAPPSIMALPSTVEAITIPHIGDIDVIEKTMIPFPKVNPGDIVIKVDYCGVNFIDTYYRKGLYKYQSFPAIIGKETAGTIVALPTDEAILNNPTFKGQGYKVGGKVAADFLGTHATYISVPWKIVYPVPESIPTRLAAAALLQGLTAVSFFEEAYKVKKGDTILVHTVAGGLGLLFAQLGKRIGATIIGTTSSPEKAELAKQNGADYVILYPIEDTVKRVLEITNGEGVDAVFDGVGKDTFDNNFKLIKRKGTIVSVGNASGAVEPFSVPRLVEKNVVLLRPTMSNYTYTPEEAAHYGKILFDLVEKGDLHIKIFKEYPFTAEGVKEAQRDLTERGGKTTGKLLIKVA